ncbi:hypothetical protein F4781DRAFT_143667 [Annulohypoxylon bovei var. microspora]|nr:hypothetical protein F4781DRAFT_143667 [Annulohypoxylon bovei var. microspora]
MRSTAQFALKLLALVAVAGALPAALAHGNDDEGAMDMAKEDPKPDPNSYPPTYFSHTEHVAEIYAHIALMVVSWVIMLPIAVMFSIARSRYTLAVQFLFLCTNAIGLLLGITYNANTPDLYPNNAHHKLGWLVTWVVSAQVIVSLVVRVAGVVSKNGTQKLGKEEEQAFIPVSTEAMAEHQRINDSLFPHRHRHSNDSGQGTEPTTESLRSNSVSTAVGQESPIELGDRRAHYEDDEDDLHFKPAELLPSKSANSFITKLAGKMSSKAWRIFMFGYNFVDRTVLILGYITLCTGIITFGRFFEGHGIFSGLAHWIKGGVFFWYGLLTLGRWCGSFGELGWSWNVRPKQSSQKWRPTAEFVEGALIFTYGSTNIFLEHLGNAGKEFRSQDLEHISITVLFIGGGLLAMLVESTRIRDLLNTTVYDAALVQPSHAYNDEEREALEVPKQYEFSVNPIPALVILLLGIMMSSHTQNTMISSMVHKQWGNLLTGASCARGVTYMLVYLKPPRSILPSRPPTELLTAFGLIAGGTIFMASASDTIDGMIHYDLDAMFFYTVTMGFIGLLMAWVVIVLALKGWAIRKESNRSPKAWSLVSHV